MAKIGLIDVDGHNYPNIPLMKISAYHKQLGDEVEMVVPIERKHYEKVYMSKVFSFTKDYHYYIDADEIVRGGTGYAISLINGKEVYDNSKDNELPEEIEHMYPDYSLYPVLTQDKAYGQLTRGCVRNCDFCHVCKKEGRKSVKVADLDQFWRGQKNIILNDPNILACKGWKELLKQLQDSKAIVEFNQGLDVRLATEEKISALNRIRTTKVHLAWDNPKDDLVKDFERWQKHFRRKTGTTVYVLTNFDSEISEDLYRIYTLRDLGLDPFVMVYDKEHADQTHKDLARWVNRKEIFKTTKRFKDYKKG